MSNQSRSPSEHSEAECRKTCGICMDEVGNPWPCAKTKAARATPAEAGERTLPELPETSSLGWNAATAGVMGYTQDDMRAYGQQCARYAVEEYKHTKRVQLDSEFKALIDKMSESGQTSGVLPNGSAVFVNYGEQPEDTAHLNCTACGGSGHIDDQKMIPQTNRPPLTPEEIVAFIGGHYNSMYDAEDGTVEDIKYELTVHDIQSAFRWWFDDYEDQVVAHHTDKGG